MKEALQQMVMLSATNLMTFSLILDYSIHVPGWLLKWLNLITAPGSVSNEPGSVTWLATKYFKKIHAVSWINHTDKLTTLGAQNVKIWPIINFWFSYFNISMSNCLKKTFKLKFDSCLTAVKFLTWLNFQNNQTSNIPEISPDSVLKYSKITHR